MISAIRTNEPDPEPFKGLGEKVVPPAPPPPPEWKPKDDSPGIEIHRDGRVRTVDRTKGTP